MDPHAFQGTVDRSQLWRQDPVLVSPIAPPYEDEQHGMFTYYLLKKLQESKGDVSYGKLSDYISQNVSLESLRINQKEQDPKMNVSSDVENLWQSWSFIK